MSNPCSCCEGQGPGQCPSIPGWITLHTWRGGYTVPNDLRDYDVWKKLKLDDWQDAVWLWRIVVLNTGDVADGTPMCLAQNRRAHKQWTSPAGLAEWEPLQVGTTWRGRIRSAYGEPIKRSIRESPQLQMYPVFTINDFYRLHFFNGGITATTDLISVFDGPATVAFQLVLLPNLGSGNVSCSGVSLGAPPGGGGGGPIFIEFTGALAGLDVSGLGVTGFNDDGETDYYEVVTENDGSFGANERQRLFAKVECGATTTTDVTAAIAEFNAGNGTVSVTAARAFEFALQIQCLGCNYSQEFALWGEGEESQLRFTDIYNRGNTGQGTGECPDWVEQYSNTPYLMVRKFGPDGVDGRLRREAFFADGAIAPRKPVCDPTVVLLGDGCYVEQYLSAKFNPQSCEPNTVPCANKPRLEYLIEQSVSGLHRLKALYGSDFSYWGGWIDYAASKAAGVIHTRFDEYDLADVKVLFLGGMMAGSMGALSGKFGDVSRYQHNGPIVNYDFAPGSLDALKRWLDQGERVLVLDGGIWPQKFYSALGLSSSVEPFGMYVPAGGSVTANTLNWKQWGPELPDFLSEEFHETFFQEMAVEPVPHPFTTNVRAAIDDAGNALLVSDFTFVGSGIAGQPPGTGYVTRGLITLSQKWKFDLETKPAAGLRSYTSAVPLVTPGPDAEVLGRVKGEVPVAPWFVGGAYVTVAVDYAGIVCESWRASFRLRFNHNGTIETTGVLPANATAAQVQAALAALPNIGPTPPTVLGGPLPYDIQIWLDTPLTQLQDVKQLEVLDSGCWRIDTQREGVAGSVDELQVLSRQREPSRVIVSQVTELIEPDGWGKNWDDVSAADIGTPGGGVLPVGQTGYDGQPYQKIVSVGGNCSLVPLTFYDKRGYGWGLGLSNTAAAQFLLNLRDRRTEVW